VEVITREALPSDADAISDLYLRARRAAAAAGTIPTPAHDDDAVRRWIADHVVPKLECWIATDSQGAVVGMMVLEDERLDQLYVEPDLAGHGIGTQLMLLAKRERAAGLHVTTFVANEGAQRFYSRHGFREIRRTDGSGNEERAPDIRYAWRPASARDGIRFCWRCATPLRHRPPVSCESCGQEHHNNPRPAAEAVVVRAGEVLLIRRARDPWKHCWDIPGGFLEPDEDPATAAERELREETGLDGRAVELLGVFLDHYGTESDGLPISTLNLAYRVELWTPEPVTATDAEALETRWFAVNQIPPNLAFPEHAHRVLQAAGAAGASAKRVL
jgi:ADP-ribose pyrophosphatase YjhB (NUDIX family)/ribosomal protein S18 acetylase RimI-like enzyme